MKEGNIVLSAMPQADGTLKHRPVLILRKMPGYGDFLVCGISTQINQFIKGFDEIIEANNEDYKQTGLVQASIVRLAFLAVLPKKSIAGSIGKISQQRHRQLLKNLSEYLTNND